MRNKSVINEESIEKNIENAHYRIWKIRREVFLKMISTINTLMDSGRINIKNELEGGENERQLMGAINKKYFARDSSMTLENLPIIEGLSLYDILNYEIDESGHDILLHIVKTLGADRASWLILETWGYYREEPYVNWRNLLASPTLLGLIEKEIKNNN